MLRRTWKQPAHPQSHLLRRARSYRSCCRHDASCRSPLSTLANIRTTEAVGAVLVPCRSNASVRLDIYRSRNKQDEHDEISPTILYLPSGPIVDVDFKEHDERIISTLSASSNATIVRVNYRLGNGIHYPTPIHDVLSAYDWVQRELTLESGNLAASTTRRGRTQRRISRIGVCGQLIGGSLAAMLSLTESRMGEHCIAAAALNNPVVDWLFADISHSSTTADEDNKRPQKTKPPSFAAFHRSSPISSAALLTTRSSLFRRPAAYFDPFASPVLFFRSPGADVPSDPESDPPSPSPDLAVAPKRMRKVHRVFPPTYSTLRIPRMRISLGTESPLLDQGEELVRLMRRSVTRSVREGKNGFARVAEEYGIEGDLDERGMVEARRVESLLVPGSGIWGGEQDNRWRRAVGEVGDWFGKVLGGRREEMRRDEC